jgi:hypothetical protein
MRRRAILETGLLRDWFQYSVSVTFTATNQRLPLTINLQSDADYVIVKLMADSSDDAGPGSTTRPVRGGALVNVTDQGSQRQLFDQQQPLSSTFGTAQRPFILPMVHRCPRNGTIILDVTNQGTATQRIDFVLGGYKIFLEPDRL